MFSSVAFSVLIINTFGLLFVDQSPTVFVHLYCRAVPKLPNGSVFRKSSEKVALDLNFLEFLIKTAKDDYMNAHVFKDVRQKVCP